MPTPPKPIHLIKMEGNKRHLTKAEIEVREKAEKSMVTGTEMKPSPQVKANKAAVKEFNRIKKMFQVIDKNDGIFEGVINRYCMLHSECVDLTEKMKQINEELDTLTQLKLSGEIEFLEYLDRRSGLTSAYLNIDKNLMSKRKQMLDIEKENIMTIQSALRSIPKKPEEAPTSGMAAFLAKRAGGHGS